MIESDLQAAAARSGLRLTPQRLQVLHHLAAARIHSTADEIHEALNRRPPALSRATVYNALHALVRSGLVREIPGEAAARYDAVVDRHHHFICDGCGSIEDIDWFPLPDPPRRGRRRVRDAEAIFRGVCAACAPKS